LALSQFLPSDWPHGSSSDHLTRSPYVGDPASLTFGGYGEDDMAIHPEAVAVAEKAVGYVFLDESEIDVPTAASASWPIIPGDRLIWITDRADNFSYPIALVASAYRTISRCSAGCART
jgi:hypothetical protein